MGELLQVAGLCAGYGGKEIVSDISFDARPGELCALLGPNGSGKSTLLRAVVGLLPYGGSCRLEGDELGGMPARRRACRVGYLAQRGDFPLLLRALDVVLMGYNPLLGPLEMPTAAQRAHAMDIMALMEAEAFAHKDFSSLSEGQRQLVLLARALVRDTRLIALDEPDSALDYINRHRVMGLLKARARQGGCAVLMSSHDANFALRYADRLLLLCAGRLVHNLRLDGVTGDELAAALGDIYGPVEVLAHGGHYLMV